jgi:DNA-binding transcriptional LysR family regulator
MAEAAELLSITPSALSQGLSELERRLGLDLFERQGRNRVLTVQGQEAAAHADRILASVRDMTLWADAAAKGETGLVRLGLIDIAAVNYFPETLIAFRAERPAIELRLSVGPSASLVSQLVSGQLDAAVIVEASASPSPILTDDGQGDDASALTTVELFHEELAIYAPVDPGDDRTARRRVGKPSTWGPWVTFPPQSHTRGLVAAALRELGAEFRVEAESHQPEVLRQMVNLGMGWTVLPVLQAETEPNPLIRARRRPLLTRRLVIARRRGTPTDPATSELIARLRQRAGELSPAGGTQTP